MITQADLKPLIERQSVPGSPVLSVYLDVDQGKPANFHRGFETSLNNMLRSIERQIDESQLKNFLADADPLKEFVSAYTPNAKGLSIFCDSSENLFRIHEFNVAIRSDARWTNIPHILPLVELINEYHRYGGVLADKAHARIFTVSMGEIEFHRELQAPLEVKHVSLTGFDHILSQKRFQVKSDTHAKSHLNNLAALLDHLVDRYSWDHLLLAGTVEVTSELHRLLSPHLRARVAARCKLTIDATERELLEAVLRVEGEVKRNRGRNTVEDLIAGNGDRLVAVGLEETLLALAEGRVWRLVYSKDFKRDGSLCSNCGMLFVKTTGNCDYCGESLTRVDDLVELVIKSVLEADGHVEEVAGAPAEALQKAGGVGALLRFKYRTPA